MAKRSERSDSRSRADQNELTVPYHPRDVWKDFHASPARFRVAVAHRRAGKTVAFINEAILKAHRCDRIKPHFGYIAPYLRQAKSIAWDALKLYCAGLPGVRFS